MIPDKNPQSQSPLDTKNIRLLIGYTTILAVVASFLLLFTFVGKPYFEPPSESTPIVSAADSTANQAAGMDSLKSEDSTKTAKNIVAKSIVKKTIFSESRKAQLLVKLLGMMILCGIIGACTCNFRGFFHYYDEKWGFPTKLEIPYYIRPAMGALSGILIFFVGNFINSESINTNGSWTTLTGTFPYLGFAFLAGFGSREFFTKLKDVTQVLFGITPNETPSKENPESSNPQKPDGGGGVATDTNNGQPVTQSKPDNVKVTTGNLESSRVQTE